MEKIKSNTSSNSNYEDFEQKISDNNIPIQAQLEFFKEQCELLKKEVGKLATENEILIKKKDELTRENEQILQMTLQEKKQEEKINVTLKEKDPSMY